MDDLALGRVVRLSRIERRWRQQDLADRAGASRSTISRIERGHLGEVTIATLRAVATALDLRVELRARARAIDLDRVINGRHAGMADYVAAWIVGIPGWEVRPEVSFSEYGERGVIDLLCWHAPSRSLLVVELKTELLDFGELLAKLDIKERLAPVVAGRLGWRPLSVSSCLLVAESMTNRRRLAAHRSLVRAALPSDGRALVGWLKRPSGPVRAVRFVPDARQGHARNGFAGPTRVRTVGRGPARR